MGAAGTTLMGLLEEANTLRRKGALDDAVDRYRRVLGQDPRHADSLYYLAQISCQQGHVSTGIGLVRQALAIDPQHGRAHNLHAMALSALGQPAEALASFDLAIKLQPELASAHAGRGDVLAVLGRHAEATESYNRALEIDEAAADSWCNRGVSLQQLGRYEEALSSYERAIELDPDSVEVHLNVATVLGLLGRFAEVPAHCDRFLGCRPDSVNALVVKGNALRVLGRHEEALSNYDRACALDPTLLTALVNRGLTLRDLGRQPEALASYESALELAPEDPQVWNHRGVALLELRQHSEALDSFARAIAADPHDADFHFNHGNGMIALARYEEALACFDRALALRPGDAATLTNRGTVLVKLRRAEEALASYDDALATTPDHVDAIIGRGTILFDRKRPYEALVCFDRALELQPDHLTALNNRGLALMSLGRRAESIESQERVLAMDPHNGHAFSSLLFSCLAACDWKRLKRLETEYGDLAQDENLVVEPFAILELSSNPMDHLRSARNYVRPYLATVRPLPMRPLTSSAGRIRLAYLSMDFRRHPVAYAIAELLELHDRSKFDVIGVSYGRNDHSDIRERISNAFDQFHDVSALSDRDIAETIRRLEVDILVDLGGYTENARPGIMALRPAPVQVNYLGYSATMGADFIDYVIADEIVLPFSERDAYVEKIVHLPDCYLVNGQPRRIAFIAPSRSDVGLPEQGFVFCSFNNCWKIRDEIFDVWMRLLSRVPDSFLWLAQAEDLAMKNLQSEAAARGVDPNRLIFAPKVPSIEDHFARHRAADLFLDTLPYNAHSTVSDALWMGLPVLTCRGRSFTGRVASSVLLAAGLPELVTGNIAEYEALALRLATDRDVLGAIRSKLVANRDQCALFDMRRFRRHIEAAYTNMWSRALRGEPPESFAVSPVDNGLFPAALDGFESALKVDSNNASAWTNRASELWALDRRAESLASYEKALGLSPDMIEALIGYGKALRELNRYGDALASYERVLAIRPDDVTALLGRAQLLGLVNRIDDSLVECDKLLALDPDNVLALVTRGDALAALHLPVAALQAFDQALELEPNNIYALNNRTNALQGLNRYKEALDDLERVQAMLPQYADAHLNEALVRFCLGDLRKAWEKYEWRWKCKDWSEKLRPFSQPLWLGQESLAGRSIFLHAEQGLGDTLHFIRYVALVIERGARVVLEVQPLLKVLASEIKGVSSVISRGEPIPACDFHCPFLSLPLAFGTELDTIPCQVPYLWPPADRVARWKARFPKGDKLRVGLAWSGNPRNPLDAIRSMSLLQLAPLFEIDGIEFLSLQKDIRNHDVEALRGFRQIANLGPDLRDFGDTAAAIMELDLVIAVDTAVAHLVGALGRPVWVPLPFSPGWRWLLERDDSPWYPSARLFRQPKPGDWESVVLELKHQLQSWSEQRSSIVSNEPDGAIG